MLRRILVLALPLVFSSCFLFRPKPPSYEAIRLESGLVVRDLLVPEKGAPIESGDSVSIHYELRLNDRTLVESSRDTGIPLSFRVGAGEVPPGVDEGVLGMRLFGSRRLDMPSELAFGSAGRPPKIPPDARVLFELEVMEHDPAEALEP